MFHIIMNFFVIYEAEFIKMIATTKIITLLMINKVFFKIIDFFKNKRSSFRLIK